MANEVVKYHNDLNSISMRNWTAEEMDFFFAIIARIREKGTDTIEFSAEEVKKLSKFSDKHIARWEKTMESAANKITQINYVERSNRKIRSMNLFSIFEVDLHEMTVMVQVSPYFEYILNKLTGTFTVYELAEFVELNSTYSKTAYRLLKQWRTKGVREFPIEEFRYLFDIPSSYSAGNIKQRVIQPILQELPAYFSKLKCKIITSNTRGTPVTGYRFTWQQEKAGKWIEGKYDNKDSKGKKKTRTEILPKWAEEGYVPEKDESLSMEETFNWNLKLYYLRKDDPQGIEKIIMSFNKIYGENMFQKLLSEVKKKQTDYD